MSDAVVEVWRGPRIESRHRVSVAVVDATGKVRAQAGDPALTTFARSAVKPFQARPLVVDGGVERFDLTPKDLALCCASHGGEPFHVEAVRALLRKVGTDADAFVCGADRPMHEPSARALDRAGQEPGRIHNNCSGKHAGMLALIRMHGWPLPHYGRPDHPLQRRMLAEIAEWTGLEPDAIETGVDGCGLCTFALPLTALAGAFARFAAAARRESGDPAAARIIEAMIRHPEIVAGTDRLDTDLMRAARGRIFVKVGAEGVYAAGIPGAELGIALKVEDGARRAVEPALIGVLRALGLLSDEEMRALAAYAEPDIENTRGDRVGRVRANIVLEAGRG